MCDSNETKTWKIFAQGAGGFFAGAAVGMALTPFIGPAGYVVGVKLAKLGGYVGAANALGDDEYGNKMRKGIAGRLMYPL